MNKFWQTSQRKLDCSEKTLVMAILNVTPDSFSDGGKFNSVENAIKQAEKLILEGADILDIGGESTRPSSKRVSSGVEMERVIPIIKAIKKHFDIAISIDTSKAEVAEMACEVGAEIINDISGLKFDEGVAEVAATYQTGLILMHLRGEFETMHKQNVAQDILKEVSEGFNESIKIAKSFGVKDEQICLDVGIGFSKTFTQNLELIAKLDKLCQAFEKYPMMVGTSRKSFIGKILNDIPTNERLNGTLASNAIAVWNGVKVVRVHDVKATVEALEVVNTLKLFA